MKHLCKITSLVALMAVLAFGEAAAAIRLTIDVTERTHAQAVVVYQTTIVEIPLDEKGHGEYVFENLPAVHAELFYGMDKKRFFLEDGDDIAVSFVGNAFKETLAFNVKSCPGKEKIYQYLNEVQLIGPAQEAFLLPFDDYQTEVGNKERAGIRLLKAWKLDAFSPLFVKIEEGRIHYSLAQMLLMYPIGHISLAQDTLYHPDDHYYQVIESNMQEDRELTGLKEYREYMKEAAYALAMRGKRPTSLYNKTVTQMEYLIDHLKDEAVLQALLNVLAIEQVEQYGIKDIDELLNYHRTYVTDPVLKAAFQEKYDKWDLIHKGKPSPDFRAFDKDRKAYTLADFAGKYLYIDLWATWCAPCRGELPFLRQLEEDYKDDNVTFVSLSIDEKSAVWKAFIEKQQMAGIQLFLGASSSFYKAYGITGIPHFIMIGPDGTIVDENMLRPSSPEIRSYFDRLPGLKKN